MSALQAELAALKKENEKLNMMAEIEKLKKDNEELAQAAEAAKEDNPEEDTLEEDFSAFKSPGGKAAFMAKAAAAGSAFAAVEEEDDFSSFRSPGGKEAQFLEPGAEKERLAAEAAALEAAIQSKNAELGAAVAATTEALNASSDGPSATAALRTAADLSKENVNTDCADFTKLVCEIMGGFLADAGVATEGCRAVCYLAKRSDTCLGTLDQEGVGVLVTGAMKKHSGDLGTQLSAAKAIINLTSRVSTNPSHLNESGELIIKAMGSFNEERDMQLFGALALKNLAHNDHSSNVVPSWGEAAIELMSATALKSRWAQDVDLNKTTCGTTGIVTRAMKAAKADYVVVKACLYRKSAVFDDRLPEHPETTLEAGRAVTGIVLPGADGLQFLQVEVDTGTGSIVWCYVPMTTKEGLEVLRPA